ncbi:Guanine nucleotide-binding protein alpha-2 subunit [Kappamyces sp. JEL0680]|nr:Guanine nucleotide-binding protein alpha-2 subunit [Kappamyces sp. JEL0680]
MNPSSTSIVRSSIKVRRSENQDSEEIVIGDIEQYLKSEREAYEKYKREPKLLLLGSSDCGKSTLLKQLRILHGGGFTPKEKDVGRVRIINGVFAACSALLDLSMAEIYEISRKYRPLKEFAEEWKEFDMEITGDIVDLITALWQEPIVVEIVDKQLVSLPDTLPYFMNSISRIFSSGFVPTDLDLLNLRVVTQAITTTTIPLEENTLHVIDVSGLSHHRQQWFSYFDFVHCVIYVTSLASYNQTMVENPNENRMIDSLVLFGDVANHPLICKKSFVLFLNKKDLFEQKIRVKKIPIAGSFPNYKGKPGSVSQGIMYFDKKFRECRNEPTGMVTHVTCCTDTTTMSVIISSVLDALIQNVLKGQGFI